MASVAKVEQTETKSFFSDIGSWPAKLKDYFEDLKGEMGRVTWPSREQVKATTAVVLFAVFAFSAYFFVIDMILGRAIQRFFATFAK